jgi:hypothetical protein
MGEVWGLMRSVTQCVHCCVGQQRVRLQLQWEQQQHSSCLTLANQDGNQTQQQLLQLAAPTCDGTQGGPDVLPLNRCSCGVMEWSVEREWPINGPHLDIALSILRV